MLLAFQMNGKNLVIDNNQLQASRIGTNNWIIQSVMITGNNKRIVFINLRYLRLKLPKYIEMK